jgi:hypothetical protein
MKTGFSFNPTVLPVLPHMVHTGLWEGGYEGVCGPFTHHTCLPGGLKAVKQRPSSITAFRQSGLALISNHRTYTHTQTRCRGMESSKGEGEGSRVSIKVVTKTCTVYLLFPRIFIFSDLAVMRLHNLSKQSVGECFFFVFV